MHSERWATLGFYCMFFGLVSGWLAWAFTFIESSVSWACLILTALLGGTGVALAVPRVLMPGRRTTGLGRGPAIAPGSLVVLSLIAVATTVIGATLVHRRVPVTTAEGVASVTSDGRFALVNHGQVIRYITEPEYRALSASELASLATVGNALLTAFFVATATGVALRYRPR